MQVTATVRRNALDDETDGPPIPGPVLPTPAAVPAAFPFLDRLGPIGILAPG